MSLRHTLLLAFAALVCQSVANALVGDLDPILAAFKNGDYVAAIESGSKVPKSSPEHPKAMYLVGEAQLALDRASDAEASFRGVLSARASSVPARVGLGRALTALGKLDEAETELRAAVASDAKDPAAQRALGDTFAAANKLKEAKSALETAAKLAPGDPWTVRSLVELALRSDDSKEAAKLAKSLVKARPEHPLGPFLQGVVHERDGDVDEAIVAYEKALALDEQMLDAHKNLAILCHTMSATYSNEERVRKSLAHYERYFGLGGKDPKLENAYRQMKAFIEPHLKKQGAKSRSVEPVFELPVERAFAIDATGAECGALSHSCRTRWSGH